MQFRYLRSLLDYLLFIISVLLATEPTNIVKSFKVKNYKEQQDIWDLNIIRSTRNW